LYAGYAITKLQVWGRMLFIIALFWTVSFMTIYAVPNTRISASDWILATIPTGSTIAVEHWDDRLPIYDSERYHIESLPLYEYPDNTKKLSYINQILDQSDYLIIASNRLYRPLQELGDCVKYPHCYNLTASYYRDLFANQRGFTLVKTFRVSPLGSNDELADESFTVYDHPTVLIFKKN
ncbi:MAG: hypothetical protein NUV52_00910, partial [Candidatus Roizmanbacteria bacterium]|nr:hypothetical protein [Candidatus Roizmanbacteria bacterium]